MPSERAILSLHQCGLFEREMVHPNTCGFSSAISWWSVLRSATHNQGQATPSYINASPSACIRSLYAQGTAPVALAREKAEAIRQLVRGEDPRAGRVSITPKTFKDCMDGLLNCLLPHWRERPKTADRLRSLSDRRRNRSRMGHGWQSGLLEGPLGESDPPPSETPARASRCARVSV